MIRVTIHIKNIATNKDTLDPLIVASKEVESIDIDIRIEPPSKNPAISGAPISGGDAPAAYDIIKQLLTADSVVRITIETLIGNIAWEGLKSVYKKISKFISSNNKQKRNLWGAKMEFKTSVDKGKEQTLYFFLDNIPENQLEDAMLKIQKRITELKDIVGETYLKEIKSIGFTFDLNLKEWQIMGIEKFDGTIQDSIQ